MGDPEYENGFVVFVDRSNTSAPSMTVYVYIDNPGDAASGNKDVEPNGAFPETEMARFE